MSRGGIAPAFALEPAMVCPILTQLTGCRRFRIPTFRTLYTIPRSCLGPCAGRITPLNTVDTPRPGDKQTFNPDGTSRAFSCTEAECTARPRGHRVPTCLSPIQQSKCSSHCIADSACSPFDAFQGHAFTASIQGRLRQDPGCRDTQQALAINDHIRPEPRNPCTRRRQEA
jgi:hypothetical protein